MWEERFEQRYGFWRAFVDDVVNAYLDCGRFESGFARVRCADCGDEFLVATSCQKRGFCPSCGAKRAAAFAAFLADEVLEQVGHAMWTFSLPKMIRPYFIYSGFSVDDSVRIEPEDGQAMERVARYILRPPLSLERPRYSDGDDEVVYELRR